MTVQYDKLIINVLYLTLSVVTENGLGSAPKMNHNGKYEF